MCGGWFYLKPVLRTAESKDNLTVIFIFFKLNFYNGDLKGITFIGTKISLKMSQHLQGIIKVTIKTCNFKDYHNSLKRFYFD